MGMHSVPDKKGALVGAGEVVAHALADTVGRPPGDRASLEGVWGYDLACGAEDAVESQVLWVGKGAAALDGNVEADFLVASGDNEDCAACCAEIADSSDVGKVGFGDHVHDACSMVSAVNLALTGQLTENRVGQGAFEGHVELLPQPAVSAVTSDYVFCADMLLGIVVAIAMLDVVCKQARRNCKRNAPGSLRYPFLCFVRL